MKFLSKFTIVLSSFFLIIAFQTVVTFAAPSVIYESSTKETITSGATVEKITQFTDEGWLKISILKVDLKNPNIKIDTIHNNNCMRTLASTLTLAKSNGAVAAVNGSFYVNGKKSEPGTGTPVGPMMRSGILESIDTSLNKTANYYATFSLSKLNNVFYDYWKTKMTLIAPTQHSVPVARYNKPYYGHLDYTIITSKYRKESYGTTYSSSDVCEMVVTDGLVTEIRNRQPAVAIPVNGYVIITRTKGSKFIMNNFKVGDYVLFNINSTPNWSKLSMSVTGGAMLLKDGQIPSPFSHSANAYNREARTAVGSTRYSKQIMLITVDHKAGNSIGMTQRELASYMRNKGIYNAINLDGGGSSTMVARSPQFGTLKLFNNPKSLSQRAVVNAIGVFSVSPPSELKMLNVYSNSDTNVFVNTSRKYIVKGFDEYFNPVEIDTDKIEWNVLGINGTFKDNVFYPTSVGSGNIIATIGDVSGSVEINSLGAPTELDLSSQFICVNVSKTAKISVVGKNKNGYRAAINTNDIDWIIPDNIATIKSGVFKGNMIGSRILIATIGSTRAYLQANVLSATEVPSDLINRGGVRLTLPSDTVQKDPFRRYVPFKQGSNSFMFSVFGNVSGLTDATQKALTSKLVKKINSSFAAGSFLCTGKNNFKKSIKKSVLSTDYGYKSVVIKNSLLLQLDARKISLRLTNKYQWKWLLGKLKSSTKNNIFIFLSHTPDNFSDSYEAALFQETLVKYKKNKFKNVWVFYKDKSNSSYLKDGINYISVAGFDTKNYSKRNKSAAKYVIVRVMDNSVTYGFKSI